MQEGWWTKYHGHTESSLPFPEVRRSEVLIWWPSESPFTPPLPCTHLHVQGLIPPMLCAWSVHPQCSDAGRTYNPQWQRGAHRTGRAHNKEVVLPWPEPRDQFMPGVGWYHRNHCHKTKEGKGKTVTAWEKKTTDKPKVKREDFFFPTNLSLVMFHLQW